MHAMDNFAGVTTFLFVFYVMCFCDLILSLLSYKSDCYHRHHHHHHFCYWLQ